MGRDVAGICWAASRYWELCEKRARCWASCFEEFPGLLKGRGISAGQGTKTQAQAKVARTRNVANAPPQSVSPPTPDSGSNSDSDDNQTERPLPRPILQLHLPRTSLLFGPPPATSQSLHQHHDREPSPSLLITWRITFDWTGDAQSHISALVGVPGSWSAVDERGSLRQAGFVFDELVKRKGVLGAVRAVVEVLFEEAVVVR